MTSLSISSSDRALTFRSLAKLALANNKLGTTLERSQNILTAHGLEELFFQLCCCVSFLVVAGNSFGVISTYHTSCGVVSFFWLWWEIVLGCTDQFFGCGGK